MVAQLYITPTSCGAASYIAAAKAGILGDKVEANLANIYTKTIASGPLKGEDFKTVNPKGNVPALVLEDGTILNEGASVLFWIGDQSPDSGILPAQGTSERYLVQNVLSYIGTELHASCGPLFNPALEDSMRPALIDKLKTKLAHVNDDKLAGGKTFLVGDAFTVADSCAHPLYVTAFNVWL